MKKIPSLFERDHEGLRLVYDKVVPGCEWVIRGEGVPTVKIDGTACMIKNGVLYKRYDRKMKGGGHKPAPEGWIACEENPDKHTKHWPGWVPVGDGPEDKWHREAFDTALKDGTYELVGPKVQGNPYRTTHHLILHGGWVIYGEFSLVTFDIVRTFLENSVFEGIVWHHQDGRMCKIKRKDFGFSWPIENKIT